MKRPARQDAEELHAHALEVAPPEVLEERDVVGAGLVHDRAQDLGAARLGEGAGAGKGDDGKRRDGTGERGKRKVLVARIQHESERHMDGRDHGRG